MAYVFAPQAAIDVTTGRLVNESGLSGNVYGSLQDAQAEVSPLSVTVPGGIPSTEIPVSSNGQSGEFSDETHVQVWWRSGPYIVHLFSFDGLTETMEAAQLAAEAAASSADSLSVGVVRSVNGQVPDENGALSLTGGGTGSGILVLDEVTPVPVGTPAGTVIGRSASAEPVGQMEVIAATRTTSSAESASDVSLAIPSGTVAGDLLVAVTAVHTNSATATAPAGWVKLQEIGLGDSNFRTTTIWGYPVPTSGDIPAGAQLFAWNVGGRVGGAMFRVTGVDLTTPVLANGTVGTRPTDSTFTVPALPGSDGGLILEVSTGQIDNGVVVYPLVYSETMTTVAEIDTGGAGTRLILGIAWAMAEAGDWPEHTVATTGNDVNAFGAQVVALRSDAP